MVRLGIIVGLFILLAATLTPMVTAHKKAQAFGGGGYYYGYFNGQYQDHGDFVLAEGAYDYDANTFVNHMYANIFLGANGTHGTVGSSYIVMSMLGYPPGTSIFTVVQPGVFSTWEARVRQYDSMGLVNWNESYSYCGNTYYQPAYTDVADYGGCGTSDSIVFRDQGGNILYSIKHLCGNPVGTLNPLPPVAPAVIQGFVFNDINGNQQFDPGQGEQLIQTPNNVCGAFYNLNTSVTADGVGSSIPTYCNPNPAYMINTTYYNWTSVHSNPPAGWEATTPTQWINPQSGGVYNLWFGIRLKPVNVGCSVTYPSAVEPGEIFTAKFTVTNNSGSPISRNSGWRIGANGAGRDTNTNNYIASTWNDWARLDWSADPASTIPNGGSASFTVSNFPAKVSLTNVGEHNVGNGFAVSGTNLTPSASYGFEWQMVQEGVGWFGKCGGTIAVANKPYLQEFSGDVSSNGYIKAFNSGSGSSYIGSGGQLGVFSKSSGITEFVSAMLRGSWPTVPNGLTFANKDGSTYGGGFNATAAKTPDDYWNLGGASVSPGDLVIAGRTLATKERAAVFVNGDAYINNDIVYSSTGSWALADIPSYYLIVSGNIYISSAVSQLSGVYVSKGTIYTCTPNGDKTKITATDVASKCKNSPLTVNGAFIANKVKFLRLANTLSQGASKENPITGTTKAAEVFIAGPETWLVSPFSTANNYNAITALPPVL